MSTNELVAKLETPQQCENLEVNAIKQGREDIAVAARRRGIELRARHWRSPEDGALSDAERECVEAAFAYERALSEKRGKKVYASRTWQMIKRHGIIPAVERMVSRRDETTGYAALIEMGLEGYAFEAVVARYPNLFSGDAVRMSKARMETWK